MRIVSNYDIIEAFPEECATLLPKRIKELEKQLLKVRDFVRELPVSGFDSKTQHFIIACLKVKYGQPIESLQKLKSLLKTYKKFKKDEQKHPLEPRSQLITANMIDRAKQKPIETLYSFSKIRGRQRLTAECPFHTGDRTPSFTIYRNSNTFHCFACQLSGDSIKFYMLLNKVQFIEAVRSLINA